MTKIFFVYRLTFSNGKIYIGASQTSPNGLYTTRYRAHASTSLHGGNLPIHQAWREFGSPALEILSKHETKDDSLSEEINSIARFKSCDESIGYNVQGGGIGKESRATDRYRKIMREKVWSSATPESRAKQGESLKKWLATPEGKAACRRGYDAFLANPENRVANQAALAVWRASDANKLQCKEMAQRAAAVCSRKVIDSETGIVYDSQRAMAQALGVNDAYISRKVKAGKIKRV